MKQETYVKISDYVRSFKYGEQAVKFINVFATRIVYVAFIALLIIMALQKDERFIRVVLVTGISFVMLSVLRRIFNSERPYTKYDFEPIMKKDKTGESMPSRHVFSAFVIGIAFFYIQPWMGIIVFVLGVIMCFGRVIAGVHFPKDVIAGAIIGIVSGIIGFYIV